MTRPDIVPLNAELARRFFRHDPARTVQGVAAVRGEEVLGVAGCYRYLDKLVVFSEMSDDIRHDKRTLIMGMRAVLRMIENTKLPVYSLSDESIKGADVLLEHMGFTPYAEGVYQWHG